MWNPNLYWHLMAIISGFKSRDLQELSWLFCTHRPLPIPHRLVVPHLSRAADVVNFLLTNFFAVVALQGPVRLGVMAADEVATVPFSVGMAPAVEVTVPFLEVTAAVVEVMVLCIVWEVGMLALWAVLLVVFSFGEVHPGPHCQSCVLISYKIDQTIFYKTQTYHCKAISISSGFFKQNLLL